MARPDLSKWEIWHAADALLAANTGEPTDEQVRARLGDDHPEGVASALAGAMKAWRERRAGVAGAGLPDALATLVLALYQEQTGTAVRLIAECRALAAEQLQAAQARADQELEKTSAHLRAAEALASERGSLADRLRGELQQEQDQTIRLQAQGVRLSTAVQRATDELNGARGKNTDLREQLDAAQARTDRTRSALAREKLAQRARLRELKARQQVVAQLEATLQSAQTELQSLRIERVNLVTEREALQLRAEMAESRMAQAEALAIAAQQRTEQLYGQIDQLRAQQDQKTDERIQKLSKLLLAGGPAK